MRNGLRAFERRKPNIQLKHKIVMVERTRKGF
jgi:hypothetical protein